jgi:Skp family chaperone for outer membrane proteins
LEAREQFEAHGVWSAVERLKDTLVGLSGADRAELAPELDRLEYALTKAQAQRTGADPRQITSGMLDRLEQALTRVEQALRPQTPQRLVQMKARADAVVDVLAAWPSLPPKGIVESVQRDLESMRGGIASQVADFQTEAQRLQASLTKLGEDIMRTDARRAELESVIEQQKQRLDAAIREQGETFLRSETDRQEAFQSKADELLNSIGTRAEEQAKALIEGTKPLLDELERDRLHAEEILGAIARGGMAAGYQQRADDERQVADRFRLGTLLLGAISVVSLVGTLFVAKALNETPSFVASRLGAVAAALFALAAYTARQSANHRHEANKAQRQRLALASIGPYLADVDNDRRQDVLEAFTYLFFAPEPEEKIKEPGPGQAMQGFQVFRDFLEGLRKPSN